MVITGPTTFTATTTQTIGSGVLLTFSRPSGVTAPINGGGTVNFTPGTGSVVIASVPATGLLNAYSSFNGADFAYAPATTNATLRAPVYGTDAGFGSVAASGALTGGDNNQILATSGTAGVVTQGSTVTIPTLKLTNGTTLTASALVTIQTAANSPGGILLSGGNATIDGTAGITSGGSGDIVIRTDLGTDVLTLSTPITSTTTGGLTKTGLGTLKITGTNAQSGMTNLNEGTLQLSGTGRISTANGILNISQGAVLDLNGVSTGTAIGQFNGAGTVANTNAAAATLTVGNSNGSGTFAGVISETAGQITVIKQGTASPTWSGVSTYTGSTTINSTGIVSVTTLADGGAPSSIGQSSNLASSLVFGGASATQAFGGLSYTGTASVRTDRLFTFAGTAANSGARIQANGANNATLVWSNTGPLAFGTAGVAQGLTLGGASTGDNTFNPQITDNGAGVVSVYKADTGLWILGNSGNSYTGVTRIDGGTLRAEGTTLPAASNVTLNGGILESGGTFTRTIGTGAGQVQWGANASSGFAAGTSKLTVNLGSSPTWGNTTGFLGTGSLVLSSATALSEVDLASGFVITPGMGTTFNATTTAGSSAVTLTSGTTAGLTLGQVISGNANIPAGYTIASITSATTFTLNSGTSVLASGAPTSTTVAAGGFRQVIVIDNLNAGTDIATISGVIGSSGTGAVLAKIGGGVLNLTGANTYDGNTEIRQGTLRVLSLGQNSGVGTSSVGAWGTGAVVISNATFGSSTLTYVGAGETSSRNIQLGGGTLGSTIQSNGTGALILSNITNGTAGAKTLTLGGENTGPNEITNVLADHGGALTISKTDGSTWIMSQQHTYTGQTIITSGLLGIAADTTGPVGAPTGGPLGVGTLTLNGGSIAAIGADRTIKNPVSSLSGGSQGDNSITIDSNVATTIGFTHSNFIAAGKTLTLNGQLSFDSSTSVGSTATHNFTGSGTTIINGLINEAAGSDDILNLSLSATGGGTLKISGGAGPNLYNGSTTLSAGTLILDKLGAIANPGGTSTFNFNSGTLQATSVAIGVISNPTVISTPSAGLTGPIVSGSNTIEFAAAGTVLNSGSRTLTNDITGAGVLLLNGTVNLSESVTTGRSLTLSGTGSTTVNGLIQNNATTPATAASTLVKAGPGTLTLTNPLNTYSGGTTIESGTLKLGTADVIPDTGTVTIRKTTTAGSTDGVLDLNGKSDTIAALTLGSTTTTAANAGQAPSVINSGATASLTLGGTVTYNAGTATFENGQATISANLLLNATRVFSIANSPAAPVDMLISGAIGETGVARGLTKTGNGTLALNGANTYTGPTTISAGIVKAGVASVTNVSGAVGKNSAVSFADFGGAVLDITGFNTQIGSLTGGGTNGGNVTLGAATLTVGADGTSPAAYAGTISGGGGIIKTGVGRQTFSGTNLYSGATTLNVGILNVTGNIAGSAVTVNGGTLAGGSGASTAVGNTGAITLNGGSAATVAPGDFAVLNGTGILTANGNFSMGANTQLVITLNGTALGSGYDQLKVLGNVILNGGASAATSLASLNLFGTLSSVAAGTLFFLLDNDGVDAISGFFAGLAQGVTIPTLLNGQRYEISYTGDVATTTFAGTGNDIALRAIQTNYTLFSTTTYPGIDAENADFDGDGLTNMQEYLLGTDPKVKNFGAITYAFPGGNNQIVFPRPGISNASFPSEAGIVYKVQASADAAVWTTDQVTIPASTGANQGPFIVGNFTYSVVVSGSGATLTETVTVTDNAAAAQRFIRLFLSKP